MGEVRGRCTPSIISGLHSTTAIPGVTRCRPDRRSTERWCTAPRMIRTPSARRLWRQARRALRSFSASLERSLSCRTLSTRRCSLATRTLEMARSASETLLSSAHVDSASLPSDSNEISITWDVNARSAYDNMTRTELINLNAHGWGARFAAEALKQAEVNV